MSSFVKFIYNLLTYFFKSSIIDTVSSKPSSLKTKLKENLIMNKSKYLTNAAIIAAVYIVLTLITNALGLANGAIQVRISEALCALPMFTPAAIPGLFIGCLLSNIFTGCVIWDVIFGSLATLIGAVFTYNLRKYRRLALLPPIISNTIYRKRPHSVLSGRKRPLRQQGTFSLSARFCESTRHFGTHYSAGRTLCWVE